MIENVAKQDLSETEKEWIKNKMNELGIISKCYNEAKELVEEAKKAIKKYNIPKLEIIANKVIDRKF